MASDNRRSSDPGVPAKPGPDPTSPGEQPTHRRRIDVDVYERDQGLVVVGRLRDDRPWAAGTELVEHVHDMTLTITVRLSDLVIVAAEAEMARFPHRECPEIEPAFRGLVGLSIGRGYSRGVQERFGRALGCSHLEFLARAMGPVVIQAIPSSSLRAPDGARTALAEGGTAWLADTCHIWAVDGGIGGQKLEIGWRPGRGPYPAPTVDELRQSGAPGP